jgi:IS4 transposase
MPILPELLEKLKAQFPDSRKGQERGEWFIHTLLSIIIPFTSSRTSNLLRCLETLFGLVIAKKRYYRFMASPKIPWRRLRSCLWKMIPEPTTDSRLILVLDDYINPKTGRKIFGCGRRFDHAAKQNQSKYPWAQNIVAVALLKKIKGRWAALPLMHRFYHCKKELRDKEKLFRRLKIEFRTKLEQSAEMIGRIASAFPREAVLLVTDSWFGNDGLWSPVRKFLGERFHMLSRFRSNINIFEIVVPKEKRKVGRPRKYGRKLGTAASLAEDFRHLATEHTVDLYGRSRKVLAYDRIVMLKTLKCAVKVVWIYRKTRWIAIFSTDTTLSVQRMIEYYGARWKIEAGFKELKQDIGSIESQTRHPVAVANHLKFCMMASTLSWIYADRLDKTPRRRHAVSGRGHFAFSDVRKLVAEEVSRDDFNMLCPVSSKSNVYSLTSALLRLAA